MEEIIIDNPQIIKRKTFDFKENKVETITLDELKRTYKENDVLGNPLRGMYHYEIIEEMEKILLNLGLKMEIDEIFAAKNNSKQNQSVVINPAIEEKYGENAIEAHVLRRVFANIKVRDFDTDELTTNIGLAFHQNAVQIGYGPMVKVCKNQCILSPERVLTTSRGVTIKQIIDQFAGAMNKIQQHIEEDKSFIERMKEHEMPSSHILQLIGMFEVNTVSYYSKNQSIRSSDYFPLTMCQIGKFTEDMLIELQRTNNHVSLWDVYNVATNLYKADEMEIPAMFSQHLALNRHIKGLLE